jgi:hypothetical protein
LRLPGSLSWSAQVAEASVPWGGCSCRLPRAIWEDGERGKAMRENGTLAFECGGKPREGMCHGIGPSRLAGVLPSSEDS